MTKVVVGASADAGRRHAMMPHGEAEVEVFLAESEALGAAQNWGDRAIEVNTRLIELVPNLVPAYNRLARCMRERGELDAAAEMYRRVLDIDPTNNLGYNRLAAIIQPSQSSQASRPSVSGRGSAAVTQADIDALAAASARLPVVLGPIYFEHEYLVNVFLTVLDLQMHNRAVDGAIAYFRNERAATAKTLDDLVRLLADRPNDQDGNTAVATYLWGNRHWVRIRWLRGFVRFLTEEGLTDADSLKTWAHSSEFKRDFEGRVPYLSLAAYQWLRMRLGVDTVKPDVHLHAYCSKAVGHRLTDLALIDLVVRTAHALGLAARDLDGRIWEFQRGAPGAI